MSTDAAVISFPIVRPKPGYKTTEFWVTLFGSVASIIPDLLPPAWRGIALIILPAVYTLGRSYVTGKTQAPPPILLNPPLPLKAAA
jgi:hypothetical protein